MKDAKWWREYRIRRGDSLRAYDRKRKAMSKERKLKALKDNGRTL